MAITGKRKTNTNSEPPSAEKRRYWLRSSSNPVPDQPISSNNEPLNETVVDKTLVCKGFWDMYFTVGRVCLPHGFGKTFNLSLIQLFFGSNLHLDEIKDIHNNPNKPTCAYSEEVQKQLNNRRRSLFNGSLLQRMHGEFFNEHFAKYPVIYLDFKVRKHCSVHFIRSTLAKRMSFLFKIVS